MGDRFIVLPLVLKHGGVLRVILAQVLGMTDPAGPRLEVPPGSGTCLRLPPHPGLPGLVGHGR